MSELLPDDFSLLPDSEAKRNAENLEHKLQLLLEQMGDTGLSESKLKPIHKEANETWYRMNAQVGRAYEEKRKSWKEDLKFYLSLIISLFALAVSITSWLKST